MSVLRVGVLAYPGCFASEVYGVPDLLTMATHVAGPDPPTYTVFTASSTSTSWRSKSAISSSRVLMPTACCAEPAYDERPDRHS